MIMIIVLISSRWLYVVLIVCRSNPTSGCLVPVCSSQSEFWYFTCRVCAEPTTIIGLLGSRSESARLYTDPSARIIFLPPNVNERPQARMVDRDGYRDHPQWRCVRKFQYRVRRCRGEKEGKGDSREEPDEEAHGRWEDALTSLEGGLHR